MCEFSQGKSRRVLPIAIVVLLALSSLCRRLYPVPYVGENVADFVQGLLLGLAVCLIALGAIRARRQRNGCRS